METKEYIITSESSEELMKEAAAALLTTGVDRLQFQTVAPMTETGSTSRILSIDGAMVIVDEAAYLSFVDIYFATKAETEEAFYQQVLEDKFAAEAAMQASWEEAGYEWPFKN